MKIFNLFLFLFGVALFISSCESEYQPPHEIIPKGGFVRWDDEVEKLNFVFDLTQNPNPIFEGPIAAPGGNVVAYDLSVTLVAATGNVGPVDFLSITTFPNKLSFTAQEVADALGIPLADLKGRLDFNAVVTNDEGISFTADNFTGDLFNPGERQAMRFSITLICPSDLGGELDYVQTNMKANGAACDGEITGTVSWTERAGEEGVYDLSDASFGQFGNCYGDTPAVGLKLTDSCNIISLSGIDQYGDSYTYEVISVNGAALTLNWENTFADSGTVVLTRKDGKNWPDLAD